MLLAYAGVSEVSLATNVRFLDHEINHTANIS